MNRSNISLAVKLVSFGALIHTVCRELRIAFVDTYQYIVFIRWIDDEILKSLEDTNLKLCGTQKALLRNVESSLSIRSMALFEAGILSDD